MYKNLSCLTLAMVLAMGAQTAQAGVICIENACHFEGYEPISSQPAQTVPTLWLGQYYLDGKVVDYTPPPVMATAPSNTVVGPYYETTVAGPYETTVVGPSAPVVGPTATTAAATPTYWLGQYYLAGKVVDYTPPPVEVQTPYMTVVGPSYDITSLGPTAIAPFSETVVGPTFATGSSLNIENSLTNLAGGMSVSGLSYLSPTQLTSLGLGSLSGIDLSSLPAGLTLSSLSTLNPNELANAGLSSLIGTNLSSLAGGVNLNSLASLNPNQLSVLGLGSITSGLTSSVTGALSGITSGITSGLTSAISGVTSGLTSSITGGLTSAFGGGQLSSLQGLMSNTSMSGLSLSGLTSGFGGIGSSLTSLSSLSSSGLTSSVSGSIANVSAGAFSGITNGSYLSGSGSSSSSSGGGSGGSNNTAWKVM